MVLAIGKVKIRGGRRTMMTASSQTAVIEAVAEAGLNMGRVGDRPEKLW